MRFSSAKREGRKETDFNPGPGAYEEQKSFTMNRPPSYHIAKKLSTQEDQLHPGPGQYDHQKQKNYDI